MKKTFIILLIALAATSQAFGQQFKMAGANDPRTKGMAPENSEFYAPVPKVVQAGDIKTNSAPSDAIVLFDGTNLDKWLGPNDTAPGWTINKDGSMTVNKKAGDIHTKDVFESFQLHIEWMVPENITGSGQARGNSGVYLQNRYEVQILDTYGNETYVNGQAASIYKQSAPLANPCRKPGEWNTYDIIYSAPVFKEDGTYRVNPYVTILFNGVLVQDHTMILGTTEYVGFPTVQAHGADCILLQSHGDPSAPISFRNIWIRKL